jgi:hypothetical protein
MAEFDKEPNEYGTWVPAADPDAIREEQAELAKVKSSVPVIQDVIEWFEQQIKDFLNPMTIEGVTHSTSAEDVKNAVLFAQSSAASYAAKSKAFRSSFTEYLQHKDEVADE